jgi:hypothetical protein
MGLLDKAQSKSQSTAVKGLLKKAADSKGKAAEAPRGESSVEIDSSKKSVIDFMAITLIERINRLSPSPSRTFTALSLLKTYASFAAGLCVTPRGDVYESYASIGLEDPKVSIPAAILRQALQSQDPSEVKSIGTPKTLGILYRSDEVPVWAIPLTSDPFHSPLLLILENPRTPFETENVLSIVQSCAPVFFETPPTGEDVKSRTTESDREIRIFLEKAFGQFQKDDKGILILVFNADEPGDSSLSTLSDRMENTALVFTTPKHRLLVACSALQDPLLLGTHVSKITKLKPLGSFRAPSVEAALGSLQSIP